MSNALQLVVVGAEWSQRFVEERSRIAGALGGSALDIQHIGSTAIPGITAKPILDIAVAVRDYATGCTLVGAPTGLGYTYRGENGIPRRHYFEREDTCHVHMFEFESPDWRRHVRFRDRLLALPALAARYAEVKREAAREAKGDRDRYQSLKAPFIQEVQGR